MKSSVKLGSEFASRDPRGTLIGRGEAVRARHRREVWLNGLSRIISPNQLNPVSPLLFGNCAPAPPKADMDREMKNGQRSENEPPLPLASIAELRTARPNDVVGLVRPLSEGLRIKLALYCFDRPDLRRLGLTVTSTVDPERLATAGGALGEGLALESRAAALSLGI